MPYKVVSVGHGKYRVINAETGAVKARATTKVRAHAQKRLLVGIEHGMKPRGT